MKKEKYQIVIGYTVKLFADGLEAIIESFKQFTVTEMLSLGPRFIEQLKRINYPFILVIELKYPNIKDVEYIKRLLLKFPNIQILLISHLVQIPISSRLIESGIGAYLLKSCSKQDISTALNKLVEHQNYFCSDITKWLINNNHKPETKVNLTERETEILKMLANCNTNGQIASTLQLSENTVKTHRKNIQYKFGVKNLVGMIRFACRSKLLNFGSDDFCSACPYCGEFHSFSFFISLLLLF